MNKKVFSNYDLTLEGVHLSLVLSHSEEKEDLSFWLFSISYPISIFWQIWTQFFQARGSQKVIPNKATFSLFDKLLNNVLPSWLGQKEALSFSFRSNKIFYFL